MSFQILKFENVRPSVAEVTASVRKTKPNHLCIRLSKKVCIKAGIKAKTSLLPAIDPVRHLMQLKQADGHTALHNSARSLFSSGGSSCYLEIPLTPELRRLFRSGDKFDLGLSSICAGEVIFKLPKRKDVSNG